MVAGGVGRVEDGFVGIVCGVGRVEGDSVGVVCGFGGGHCVGQVSGVIHNPHGLTAGVVVVTAGLLVAFVIGKTGFGFGLLLCGLIVL